MKIFSDRYFNKRNKNKVLNLLLSIIILFCSLSFSEIKVNAIQNAAYEAEIDNNEELLSELRAIIKTYYLKPVSNDILDSDNIKDMISKLNDPYSTYFTKEEYNEFVNQIDNKFVGIGIRIEVVEEGIKVIDVMKGSPAEEVGIRVNDIILKANNTSLAGLPSEEAVKYIKGEEGTKVTVLIKRQNNTLEYTATRKAISMPTAEGELINDIGYISVYSFGEETGSEFSRALNEVNLKGAKAYIVDLRYNPGGYIYSALDIGGHFIGSEPMVLMKDKEKTITTFNGFYHGKTIDKPVIFIIDEYSASASELLSAALKDYKKAFFIGETTYGKGVAQSMFGLTDGSMIKLTTNEFLSPLGNTINHVGITPDFSVEDDNLDPRIVANILFSCVGKEKEIEAYSNKIGYVKVRINNNTFYISLDEVRKDENWEAYSAILEKVKSEDIYVGTESGWSASTKDNITNKSGLYYPEYKSFININKSKYDKSIAVTFNNSLKDETISNNNVQLINSKTGERVEISLKVDSTNRIIINTKRELKEGETYLLLISKEVKSEKGLSLSKGILSKISIVN